MFADCSVDFISAIYTEPKKVLNEWHRVLKVGGHIGIIVPSRKGLVPDKEAIGPPPWGHAFDYNVDMLQALVADMDGLEVKEIDTLGNGWSINFVLRKNK